jgi:hypothetical protein
MKEYKYSDRLTINEMGIVDGEVIKVVVKMERELMEERRCELLLRSRSTERDGPSVHLRRERSFWKMRSMSGPHFSEYQMADTHTGAIS